MAVDAKHLNLFHPQFAPNRDLVMNTSHQVNSFAPNVGIMALPGFGFNTTEQENGVPVYQSRVCDSAQAQAKRGLMYNIPTPPGKRARDSTADQFYSLPSSYESSNMIQFPSFVSDDVLPQTQQCQSEVDTIVSQYTKKIRVELEEKEKHRRRLLMAAIRQEAMRKLKEKDEQIDTMTKLNLILHERAKSLYVENQLLRDLAQSNQAAANSLRSNLEQVLAHVSDNGGAAEEEDAESCCGSSGHDNDDVEWRGFVRVAKDKEDGRGEAQVRDKGLCYNDRACRRCRDGESSVLLLPCRHLCLCSRCGSGARRVQTCPVCDFSVTATLHVNRSS